MAREIEIEKTYLAKYLPSGLKDCESKEIIDFYVPKNAAHARLRIRKNGSIFVITKKKPIKAGDASTQFEDNIEINEDEFKAFYDLPSDRIRKIRYYYPCGGKTAEIDVFLEDLLGLVVVDFEFKNTEEMVNFIKPDFCLVDVTDEEFVAGGVLCRHSFASLKKEWERLSYQKLSF